MNINRSLRLPDGEFVAEQSSKNLIVLHFTAGGNASGAFQTWVNDRTSTGGKLRVATPYIVDRDGTIYEVFNPDLWAFHLGIKGTSVIDRRSIGIEIVNWGPLYREGNNLMAWTKRPATTISQKDQYVEVPGGYRGYNYYHAFPAVQTEAVAQLVNYLCDRYSIPRVIPPPAERLVYNLGKFKDWKGIATHVNYRTDKYDIGPAYNWSTLKL